VKFLAAGPPPVYLGFGSMRSRDPVATTRILLDALERSGQRGLLSSGWSGLSSDDLPESVALVGDVPHEWLLPQTAAVVHHGGAGTTGAAVRAGVPQLAVPHVGDQPYWGRRVAQLGIGPAPVRRHELATDRLADLIGQMTSDVRMRARAAEIGVAVRAEDGVAVAVEQLSAYLGGS
jgi:UDP:flavonoid glycosyltransferase YjiC (YdhE family)